MAIARDISAFRFFAIAVLLLSKVSFGDSILAVYTCSVKLSSTHGLLLCFTGSCFGSTCSVMLLSTHGLLLCFVGSYFGSTRSVMLLSTHGLLLCFVGSCFGSTCSVALVYTWFAVWFR